MKHLSWFHAEDIHHIYSAQISPSLSYLGGTTGPKIMLFSLTLFPYDVNEMLEELSSCLYQLAWGNIAFVMCLHLSHSTVVVSSSCILLL